MIEEGAAERTHKEIVSQHVLFCDLPQRQSGTGIMTHDESARVGIGDEPIVLAAGDLHLVLIKGVPQISGRNAERQIEALWVVDCKGCIGQALGLGLSY